MTTTTDLDPEADLPASVEAPESTRHFGLLLGLITLAGFAWRLGYTLATSKFDDQFNHQGDAFFYSHVASYFAAGHLYVNPFNGAPAADHPPLTVLVLTPASWLFRDSLLAQRLTMTLIGTAVVVTIGLLGRYIAGARVGLVAAAVAAVNPNLWMNDAVVMSESISTLLIVGCLACGYALRRHPSVAWAAIAGAMVGLTVLARAEIGLFLPFMVAPILLSAANLTWPQRLGRLALATGAMLLVIAPWSLWNQTRFHDPVPLSTNDGTTLLGANCPRSFNSNITGGWAISCVLKTNVNGLDASQASAKQRKLGIDYAKAHLGRIPLVVFAREGRTFGYWRPDQSVYINTGEGRPEWASWWGLGVFWVLIPVAIIGGFGLRRRKVTLIPIVAAAVTVVVVSAMFYGIPRFRLPLDVAMCLLTAVAFVDGWDALRRSQH